MLKSIKFDDSMLEAYDSLVDDIFEERKKEVVTNENIFDERINELNKKENDILNNINKLINFPLILEKMNKDLENIKTEKYKIDLERKNTKN
jgi:hypothetical protein